MQLKVQQQLESYTKQVVAYFATDMEMYKGNRFPTTDKFDTKVHTNAHPCSTYLYINIYSILFYST